MRFHKCLKHAFNMVVHSKLRSWLTILGIVIGVGSVIAIMSLGSGLQQAVESQLGSLGGDILTLQAGASRGGGFFGRDRGPGGGGGASQATEEEVVLEWSDYQALKGIPDIALMDTQIRGNVKVSYLGKSGTVSLTGVDQKVWARITTSEIADGRMLDTADQNVIVIGGRLAKSYFDQPLGINKMLTIETSTYRIVGVLDDESTSIYMPIQLATQLIDDAKTGVYDSIIIKVKDEEKLNDTMAKIEERLMMTRHVTVKTKDFSLTSSKAIQATRAEMMSSMNMFLLAIAAVSLIVGAVGIANTMFTSVLEKTKEIGIMKAIGARNQDIMKIFLLNAGLIGLVGGVLGTLFGALLSGFLPSLIGDVGIFRSGTTVTMESVIIAMSISILIGILAGVIPAYQASRLKPVDALRYE
jgi:putative ABC transport system permease protein